MKKIILLLSILAALPCFGQYTITNIFIGTTPGDGTGDPIYRAFTKVNYNFYLLTNWWNYSIKTNGVFGGFVSNSAETNNTYAGNGYYLNNLNGTNIQSGTLNTNACSSSFMTFLAGLASSLTMNFDGGAITSDGSGNITAGNITGGQLSFDSGAIASDGTGDLAVNTLGTANWSGGSGSGGQIDTYANFRLGAGFGSGNYWQVYWNDGSLHGFGIGYDTPGPSPYFPLYTVLTSQSAFTLNNTLDDGTGNAAFAGNVTCVSLSQTSDVNTKTNITPVDITAVLARIMATPVYRWNFRDQTRTNLVMQKMTNGTGTNYIVRVRTNVLSDVTHIGPMAQDWSARFGGKTNSISIIDMQGILLAGEQALADPTRVQVMPFVKLTPYSVTHSTNSTFGYGAGLLAVDGSSLFVSVNTNTWRRVNLLTNAW